MYDLIYRIDQSLMLLLILLWAFVTNRFSRLPYRKSKLNLKRSIHRLLVVVYVTLIITVGKMITVVLLSTYGWLFIEERMMLVLPLLIPSTLSVLLLTLPNIIKISKDSADNSQIPLDESDQVALTTANLVVPVQATLLSSLIGYYFSLFQYSFSLTFLHSFYIWFIFAIAISLLWTLQNRRNKLFIQSGYSTNTKKRLSRIVTSILVVLLVAGSWFVYYTQASALPKQYNMGINQSEESQTNSQHHHVMNENKSAKTQSLTDFKGPQKGKPDHQFHLVAQKKKLKLRSGKTIDAWTFNGKAPGPELQVKQGDLVEVILKNKDIPEGVTIHWHGYNVPNAEDGVAGVTQNSIKPGKTYIYRFQAKQTGTYWYHSHQQSASAVSKGLFGSLVVLPKDHEKQITKDITVVYHAWQTSQSTDLIPSFGLSDNLEKQIIQPGIPVRLRLINTGDEPQIFQLTGSSFKVMSIDGNNIQSPTNIKNKQLLIGAGGRYDILFTMPENPVRLSSHDGLGKLTPGILFITNLQNQKSPVIDPKAPIFDPSNYGTSTTTPFISTSKFDRNYLLVLDNRLGFYDGKIHALFTINGRVFPDTPMLMVKQGELVKTTFVNRGAVDHPMHLHGHTMLVLSRNRKSITGSPWWTDTLNVAPGETYEIAFKADNPGIWMDHCHNLTHATVGMTMHLGYEGITTPFQAGSSTPNQPE
ncbi:multicopper oxidase family protein [Shimazuella kribbensis]|uniref:multicopper oxidase family protein n=1 Tax=Shimazuella kribbensis TaxID=139808 RepID=UPI00041B75ED|nr:multicopper oxidase family protein [Shimazuella kribbensis]